MGSTRLYNLQTHKEYGFYTGKNNGNQQVLVGFSWNTDKSLPTLMMITFDEDGKFVKAFEKPIKPSERTNERLINFFNSIGFVEMSVSIQKFFVSVDIGIEDMPLIYRDFNENPDDYTKEAKLFFSSEVERWNKENLYVFWWMKDYWMNCDGKCVAY
jgi:hypothetical protein